VATADVRRTVIGIINEVERKLAVTESSFLDDRKLTTVLLDFLNDVIDEVNDFGDWPQMFREIDVTASSSVDTIELAVSAQIKNIYEIHYGVQVSPLQVKSVEDMRRLQRTGSTGGEPRQFAVVDTSGVNPRIRTYPVHTSALASAVFDVAYYKKNRIYTTVTADTTAIPAFPSRMLVQGVYAKALLEESGQEPTAQYQIAYQEYIKMRTEAFNRLTSDTGTDVFFTPTGRSF
jgi:hypothetical protein